MNKPIFNEKMFLKFAYQGIYKYYDMPTSYKGKQDPGKIMGFSSYPGAPTSTDDYYLIDSGLVRARTARVFN